MDRWKVPHTDIELGGFIIEPAPAWWKRGGKVMMRCNYGDLLVLDHEIDNEGNVNPSVFHDGRCGWHAFITLEEYDKYGK